MKWTIEISLLIKELICTDYKKNPNNIPQYAVSKDNNFAL